MDHQVICKCEMACDELMKRPGVGKTSTAECVADSTKRPLFQITCGDIGDTATEVERNLESSFKLAHKWGCVLLLDEADIFLQKRDRADIKRNAIVSVFLRSLEYYAGSKQYPPASYV
jgi:SpoVK/Ycf46/Vps4 family AAA+-type ATPase